jgi:hypothetical protein
MEERSLETWINDSPSTVSVTRFSGVGNDIRKEIVRPGRKFLVTTEERVMLNSERCVSDEVDSFKNGFLKPVSLVASSRDLLDDPNPNHMSESALREMFAVRKIKDFRAELDRFDSPQILRALADMAANDESVNATVTQTRAIDDKLAAVSPSDVMEITSHESFGEDDDRSTVKAFRLRE